MDIGGQNQKELQVEGSWIPQTPVRPIMPKPPVIYTDKQGNQLGVSNWLRPEGFLPGFNGGPHVDGVGACFASTNSTIFDGYRTCRDELDRWKDISFTALLAAANLAAVPANSQPYSNGNSSLGSGQCVDGNYTEEPQHGKFTHPEATYALNFHPGRMDGSFSNQITSHFAPITTDKVIKEKCKHVVEIQALCKDERTNKERNEQNQITATGIDNNEIHTDKELQKLEADSSLAGASKLVMESHKADKVGGHVIDLNKTPKQKPRRKKHRPRVITESKPRTREPVTPKPPSNGIPTSKRKYVRKKPLRKVSKTPPAEAHGKSSVVESPRPVKKSCRRALHFDMEGQGEGENSICMSASNLDSKSEKQNAGGGNQSKLTVHLSRGIEVIVESSQLDTAYDLNHSVGKMLESCILQPTKQAPATTISAETTAPKEKQSDDFKESLTEGEDQVTACNVMANSAEIFSQTDTHLPTSPHGSNCAEARQAQRSRRMHSSPIKHPDACSRNLIGMHSDILSAYQRACWAFPRICKKKRTEKVQCANTSSTVSFVTTPKHLVPERAWPQTDSKADPSTLRTSYWFSGPQSGSSGLAGALREAGRDFQLKPHASSFISKQTQRSTNERSKVPIQVQAFNSVTSITQCMMEHTARQKTLGGNRQQVGNPNGLFAHMEAPVALLGATLTTKKGTKKRVSLVTNLEISHTEINISKQNQLPARLPGDPPLAAQKVLSSTEVIAEQLKHLDISREDSDIAYQEQTALVPYIFKNEKQNMLVPYERDGTLVPFPIKKKHTRPKVDLDEETNRVWKLLMVNIDSEGIDGADEEKTKWWEGERNVFGGRASSFIAQMHQVQVHLQQNVAAKFHVKMGGP